VAGRIERGDVRLHRFAAPDKRRPVVVISRPGTIDLISTVMVAPITSTVRGLPSEVPLDASDGMKGPCAVNLDHVQTVRKSDLSRRVTVLGSSKMVALCRALSIAVGCS
jgi:mRNA interferase MazF